MKRVVALFAALAAGLCAPQLAHAQGVLRGVLEQAQQGGGRADEKARPEPPKPPPPTPRRISEGQAIAAVQRVAGPGRHLDVFAQEQGGRPVWVVRWASENGQRRDYVVDAVSGAVR